VSGLKARTELALSTGGTVGLRSAGRLGGIVVPMPHDQAQPTAVAVPRARTRQLASRLAIDEVVTPAEALARGISRASLHSSGFQRLDHGLYIRMDCVTGFHLWIDAALKVCPPGTALADVTALRLWGVQLPERLDRDRRIHVLVPPGAPRPARRFIATRATVDGRTQVQEQAGLRVVAPVDAWLQIAARATHEELVEIGDGLMRYKDPLSSRTDIGRVLEGWSGRRGIAVARSAYAEMRPGTESIKETQLRRTIIAAGLPEPQVQVPVYDADGVLVARGDLGYGQYLLLIEYDGKVHNSELARRRDNARRRTVEALGYRMIVATAPDLARPTPLIRAIEDAIRSQIERLGLS